MIKRFEIRRSVTCPIDVISNHWDEPVTFQTLDLSPRGAFIESAFIPSPGEHLVCSFNLGNGRQFDFFAEVVRANFMRRQTDNLNPGFGVSFLDATPLERLNIRDSLRGTPPPLPFLRRPPRDGFRIKEKDGISESFVPLFPPDF